MIRRLPLIPTLLVLLAVGVMIRLGFWQLDRLGEKEALLARYAAARTMSSELTIDDLMRASGRDQLLYRRAQVTCLRVLRWRAIAGRNARGQTGIAHIADCNVVESMGGDVLVSVPAQVVIGWSQSPETPKWAGGVVTGTLLPAPKDLPDPRNPYLSRIVADPPLAGLAANARPDPADVPNNHLSYAVQWFLFAATALVIYGIAVWKRLAGEAQRR